MNFRLENFVPLGRLELIKDFNLVYKIIGYRIN